MIENVRIAIVKSPNDMLVNSIALNFQVRY